jgi:hypothetical protein
VASPIVSAAVSSAAPAEISTYSSEMVMEINRQRGGFIICGDITRHIKICWGCGDIIGRRGRICRHMPIQRVVKNLTTVMIGAAKKS